ncbi:phosphoglucosamine mutase [Methanonatronarchaeum sp. AMET-Sl]|uniref:phosphoglucosamine mutase n=1 Tax=Methanonatronarchaeum sp. AMET-Sl TaxID=3037654 RepID=UPI00244E1C27|nr:phosphoglucosamine mutase [Methanonatronarchaeum sp. AMET-Sl]WGI18172.1 phosphoglucosamine mutase [Methanonatronarchaeum sp. AMET-Sl]
MFGTNGVRGIANDEITPEFAIEIARSLSSYVKGSITVGRDTRVSGDMLRRAVVSGIQSTGSDVIDLGVVPSPCQQYYTKNSQASSGIIITASHNPPQYNGLKLIDHEGVEYSSDELDKLEEIYNQKDYRYSDWDKPGNYQTHEPKKKYINDLTRLVDTDIIREWGPKVVVDPGNGAGCNVTPYLLRKIGCNVITLNGHPDGTFPGRDPEPIPENIQDLSKTVEAVGADLGVAHDGDADRATFVTEEGKALLGDVTLALQLKEMLKTNKGDMVVTPVSSGYKVSETVKEVGGEIVWTEVGSTAVARKMMELGDKCVGGGEENGGVIHPEFQYCRDGALTTIKIIELIAKKQKPLSKLDKELPNYQNIKTKIKVKNKNRVMQKTKQKLQEEGTEQTTIDGIKIFYSDGWLLIRPSGTEPVIRVFTEAKTKQKAKKLSKKGLKTIKEANK